MNHIYIQKLLLFFLFFNFFSTEILIGQELTASQGDNDAYIDVAWDLDKNDCLTDNNNNPFFNGVFLQLLGNGEEIYSEIITDVSGIGTSYVSSYRHEVGSNTTVNYTLNVFERGPGTLVCTYSVSGNTVAFMPPVIELMSNATSPDSIFIRWNNPSSLVNSFNLLRNNVVIGSFPALNGPGEVFSFTDGYVINGENSLNNGQTYVFCIKPFSNLTTNLPSICGNGSTIDLGFAATDDAFTDKVELTWNDMSAFADNIQVVRNGVTIKTLSNDVTTYPDNSPIYGQKSNYGIVLIRNNTSVVDNFDIGSVPKNGLVSGKVLTEADLFPVKGATVKIEGMAGDSIILDSIKTDFAGCFSFPDLYYGMETNFTLTVRKNNSTFASATKNITLNSATPQNTSTLFYQKIGFTDAEESIVISNFVVTPQNGQDKVDLSWEYTPAANDTTFFNIYRNSNIIARMNDANGAITTFTDLKGVPNTNHTYSLVIFRIDEANGSVIDGIVSAPAIFPAVAPVSQLNLFANNTLGRVDLNWGASHSSSNYQGFRVYRNDIFLAEVPVGTFSYLDLTGESGMTYTYKVTAKRTLDEVDYESTPTTHSNAVIYPVLPEPINFSVGPAPDNKDYVRILWTIPSNITTDYNYTGFRVYRSLGGQNDFEQIGAIDKGAAPAPNSQVSYFNDLTGLPNVAYDYQVSLYLEVSDTTYQSSTPVLSATFPAVKPPANFLATGGANKIDLTWDAYHSTPTSEFINQNGFILNRNGEFLANIPVGQKSYIDYLNNPPHTTDVTYELKAVRTIAGQDYFSTIATAAATPMGNGDNSPTIPSNFTASSDVPNHIKLCWEYPEFAFSIFTIRRNGQIIANLPRTTRSYYDYDAPKASEVMYSIQANYQGNPSQEAFAVGRLMYFRTISGRVQRVDSGEGVPNVLIHATSTTNGIDYYQQTSTDAAGYYLLTDIPCSVADIELNVLGNGSDFDAGVNQTNPQTSATVSVNVAQDDYIQNFTDYYLPAYANDEIATPTQVTATPDPTKMGVLISWSPKNPNYSGFEIYRGTGVIKEVLAGEPLSHLDTEGTAGINYSYNVRAFWDTDSGRQYSNTVGRTAIFPKLEPVINLTATPNISRNSMSLNWSHVYDSHDFYIIKRNDVVIGTVETGNPLMFSDTTGQPGQTYDYALTAVKGASLSEKTTVREVFPTTDYPRSLTAVIPLSPTNNANSQNKVLLAWSYSTGAANGFEIYRNGQKIGEVAGTESNYEDFTGIPNTNYNYSIAAYVIRNEERYTSRNDVLVSITYPNLAFPEAITAQSNSVSSSIDMSWTYPAIEGIDGFKIFRTDFSFQNSTQIQTIFINENSTQNFSFSDIEGIPLSSYRYIIQAFSVRDGQEYLSNGGAVGSSNLITFPALAVPSNFVGTTFQNTIKLNWVYNNAIQADGFELQRQDPNLTYQTIVTLDNGGQRSYTDILTDANTYNYRIRAIKTIDGQDYYSTYASLSMGLSADPTFFPQDFIAPPTASAQYLGQSIAMDGNWMVVGANRENNFNGAVYIYQFNGTGWTLKNKFTGINNQQLGYAVDIDGDFIVAGAPFGNDNVSNEHHKGAISIYRFNGTNWVNEKTVAYCCENGQMGRDVAIDSDWIITGITGGNKVEFYKYNGTSWNYETEYVATGPTFSLGNFGISVDMDGDYAVVGDPFYNNRKGRLTILKKTGNNWDFDNEVQAFDISANFGNKVSISGDVVMANIFNDNEAAWVFKRQSDGSWSDVPTSRIQDANSTFFARNIYLDYPNALIRGRENDIDRVFLYTDSNGDGTFAEVQDFNLGSSNAFVGYGVTGLSFTDKYFMIGAPGFDNDAGRVYNYPRFGTITSVTASDGTSSTSTFVEWTFSGDDNCLTGFEILRDDVVIPGSIGIGDRSFSDTEGLPGKEYTYTVRTKFSGNMKGVPVSDKGYREADGLLAGQVSTLQGGSPVPGVNVIAEAMIDGEYYHYEDITNAGGAFTMDKVYYGEAEATYTVRPYLDGHEFEPDSRTVVLEAALNQNTAISFLDKRAYIINGVVSQLDNVCPLDSIKVTVTSVRNNNTESVMNVFSDEDGKYSFAVNPNDVGLDSIIVDIENFRVINRNSVMADTIIHDFAASAQRIFTTNDFANFPIETTIDFIDNLTYPVQIVVQNTCEDPISSDLWTIRARTIDGCFDQSYQTHNTGDILLNLPPLDFEISVTAVDNPTVPNLTALSYFENKKAKLDLYTLHKDSSRVISPEDFNDLTKRSFTFHKTPTITLTSGFSKFFCDDPNKAAIISQNNNYTLRFGVTENHNNNNCSVKEGFIKVTNAASDNPDAVMLHYDKDANAFPAYTFTAGKPNLIEPHFYVMEVAYFSANGDFLGNKNMVVFVEGTAGVPGTDVVVNPEQGDQVQYPLFVLRDPPGDGSSASIAEGSQINKSFNLSQTEDGSLSYYDNSEIKIFGVGGNFAFNASVGGGGQQAKDWSYSITTSQKISTSNSPYNTGRNADVMVGVGLAMQYGLIQDLRAGDCDTIYQTTRFGFTPNKVNTTWVYTVEQIEGIITQFRNDSLAVEAGTREYSEGGIVFTKEDAIKRLEVYISNWEKVMEYHDIQTLPHYTLCTRGQYNHLPIAHKNAIYDWQDAFCTRIGSYQGDIFNINDPETITWDNTLVDLYNAAGTAIRNLSDSIPNPGAPLVWQYDENNPLSQYADAQYDAQFGILAENYTFGGAATIDKSLSTAQTSTKSFSSSVNFGFGLDISLTFGNETTFVLAPFGVGTLQKVADLSFTAGLKTDFKYTISESRSKAETQTVDISYTLEDNDVGDQFSVTAIQGPSQNHTPYFSLLGGRSSCPPEAGTIVRDDAILALVDPTTGATTNEMSMYDVPEGDAATFIVKLTNNNIFDENRNLFIALDNASNTNGAIVRLAGSLLGSQTFFNVGAGGDNSVFLPLTIERGLVGYNHSIRVGLQPFCADGVTGTYPLSYITLNVTFENPCTPITIVSPDDNWVINTTNGNLVVTIRDYQPDNPPLQDLRLQYRRIGSGADFDDIPLRHMKDLDAFVTAADLQAHNAMIALTEIPEYFFIWELPTDQFDLYPDGEYELRVKAQCSNSETTSNVISGTINRSGLRLFGTPEPADGLWTSGDEISFSFNKNLDCNLMTPNFVAANFSMIDKSNGDALVPFEVACLNNKLIFLTTNPMSDYDDHDLEVVLNDVKDANGNGLEDPVTWQFHVITQKVYWEKDTISLELYQGESVNITVQLENSSSVETVSGLSLGVADNTIEDNWLSFAPSTNFSVNPSGRTITLTITSENIATYSDILQVNGLAGRIPELYIEATFKPKPPYWEVEDPAQYNSSMSMIANWYFEDLGNSMTSIDTLDMISVWMDNEIRGVAKITAAGNGFYAAYIAAIYGQNTELDKDLEVRIWDADEGNMYIGTPTTTSPLQFQPNVNIGSTPNPELMEVNRTTDLIREIPLNQGWTWFSINAEQADMSLNELLGSLKVPQTGDIIKTEDGSAIYEDGLGWVSLVTDPLETMSVENGYMIRLEGGSDTLLLTGTAATLSDQFLTSGWNWIGYPRAISQNVNSVISFTPALDDGSILKVIRQDGTAALADYNSGMWTGSLTELRPFDGYKIKVENENSTILGWDLNTPFSEEETQLAQNRMDMADPMDETTWIIDGFDYEYVMPLVAQIELSGDVMEDQNDQVAIFVGNDLRGTGKITFIPALNRYEVSFLVGGIAINETLEIYFYDASADRVFSVNETLALTDEGYGNFSDPHIIPISIFNIDIDKQDVVCSSDNNGSITLEVSQGLEPYSFEWSTGSDQSSLTGLGVGIYTVTITDATNYPVELDVEIVNTAESIPGPAVTPDSPIACQGSSVTLSASNPTHPNASFSWYNANGNLLQNGSTFTLNNIQTSQTIRAYTQVNGACLSDPKEVVITMEAWADATFTVDDRTPVANAQEITFSPTTIDPTVTYQWSFGDGTTATGAPIRHTYTTQDVFDIVLTTTTANNCGFTSFSNNYIVTDGSQQICSSTLDSDNDGWKDDCDNCPFISNALQVDDDGDFVGNVCDCDSNNAANPNNPRVAQDFILGTADVAGYYQAINVITSNGLVTSHSEFKAGQSITLGAGFETPVGFDFYAHIATCNAPAPVAGDIIVDERVEEEDETELVEIPGNDLKVIPNPVSNMAVIHYQLSEQVPVVVTVHSITGTLVETLILNEIQDQGEYEVPFNAERLEDGMYYVLLKAGDKVQTRKLVLLK